MVDTSNPLSPMRRRAIDKLLIQYLELPERDQAAWLEETFRRRPRLGRWLKELTETGHTVTLLDDSVRNMADLAMQSSPLTHKTLEPDTLLGPWVVREPAGQGGMGMVYRGERADGAFEMDVAIKLISRRQRGLAELLQRESRLLARLDHPSVTRLVDAGLDERAGPFLVMEWVEGADLDEWLKSENPSMDQRLALFEQIVEATAHAHQRLIVHGDIKPGNIRIREDGTVKLMDFGVSQFVQAEEAQNRDLRALTPAFAAPELRAGADLAPQSDIWSLGATLFWLMTGQVIDRTNDRERSSMLSERVPRHHELAAIIDTACAESAQQRYSTASDLLADLERYRRDEPLRCMPLSVPARALKFTRRNRLLVGTGSLLALSMISGLIVSSLLYLQAEEERQATARSEQAARTVTAQQQALLSDMAPNVLSDRLLLGLREAIREAEMPETNMQALNEIVEVASPVDILRDALVSNVLEPARVRFADDLHDNPETAAALQHSLASVHSNWGMHGDAQAGFETAWRLRAQALGKNHPETIASRREQAIAMNNAGETEKALDLIHTVHEQARKALGKDHQETLAAHHVLGGILVQRGQLDDAIEALETTLRQRERLLGTDHVDTLNTTSSLAVAKVNAGQLEAAGALFEQVFDRRREILGDEHPDTLTAVNNLAGFRFQTGDPDRGLELIRLAEDITIRLNGRRHPTTLFYQHNQAQLLIHLGQFEDALQLHQQIHETRKEVLGTLHPETLLSSVEVATTLNHLGRRKEALQTIVETHDHMLESFGPDHRETLLARQRIGTIMLDIGDQDEALNHLEQAYQGLYQTTRPDSSHSLIALARFLSALDSTARYEQAERIIDANPALPGPPQGPTLVNEWRFLYYIIAELYDNWHAQSPDLGHDETADYWRALMAELEG